MIKLNQLRYIYRLNQYMYNLFKNFKFTQDFQIIF